MKLYDRKLFCKKIYRNHQHAGSIQQMMATAAVHNWHNCIIQHTINNTCRTHYGGLTVMPRLVSLPV